MKDILVRGDLKPEIIEGWKVSAEEKRLWNIELLLAKELLFFCSSNNLKIVAAGGTLLGAIRHEGFIPWDDDMDFFMPRADYEKLCSLGSSFKHPFFLQTTKSEKGAWFRGYARLRYTESTCINPLDVDNYSCNNGVFIDIFPLDSVPKEKNELERFRRRVKHKKSLILHNIYSNHYEKNGGIKAKIYSLYSKFFSGKRDPILLSEEYDCLCSRYSDDTSLGLRIISFNFLKGTRFDFDYRYSDLFPTTMHKFELIEIPIPCNWEIALKKAFGDSFMDYPPIRERTAQEKNITNPDIPYYEYMKQMRDKEIDQ